MSDWASQEKETTGVEPVVQSGRVRKKSGLKAFLKFIAAVVIVCAAIWIKYSILDLPKALSLLIVPLSLVLAVIVLLLGDFSRLVVYVRASFQEVRKVVWPQRNYTVRMTGFVIAFVAVLAIFVYAVDTLISWLLFDLFLKRG